MADGRWMMGIREQSVNAFPGGLDSLLKDCKQVRNQRQKYKLRHYNKRWQSVNSCEIHLCS